MVDITCHVFYTKQMGIITTNCKLQMARTQLALRHPRQFQTGHTDGRKDKVLTSRPRPVAGSDIMGEGWGGGGV